CGEPGIRKAVEQVRASGDFTEHPSGTLEPHDTHHAVGAHVPVRQDRAGAEWNPHVVPEEVLVPRLRPDRHHAELEEEHLRVADPGHLVPVVHGRPAPRINIYLAVPRATMAFERDLRPKWGDSYEGHPAQCDQRLHVISWLRFAV